MVLPSFKSEIILRVKIHNVRVFSFCKYPLKNKCIVSAKRAAVTCVSFNFISITEPLRIQNVVRASKTFCLAFWSSKLGAWEGAPSSTNSSISSEQNLELSLNLPSSDLNPKVPCCRLIPSSYNVSVEDFKMLGLPVLMMSKKSLLLIPDSSDVSSIPFKSFSVTPVSVDA